MAYVLTTSGHGEKIANGGTPGYAIVRTDSGAWVGGRVLRTWEDRSAAMRDHVSPESRWRSYVRAVYVHPGVAE